MYSRIVPSAHTLCSARSETSGYSFSSVIKITKFWFGKASPKFIRGDGTRPVANKFGWSGTAIHDVSIVFADNPYITVALSNLGETSEYNSYFNKANEFSQRLHNEYWKYKMNMCNNIKQY